MRPPSPLILGALRGAPSRTAPIRELSPTSEVVPYPKPFALGGTKADARNKALIAAVNRCATEN
jgi:hypothetical protein